jgi:hypothetical protein
VAVVVLSGESLEVVAGGEFGQQVVAGAAVVMLSVGAEYVYGEAIVMSRGPGRCG